MAEAFPEASGISMSLEVLRKLKVPDETSKIAIVNGKLYLLAVPTVLTTYINVFSSNDFTGISRVELSGYRVEDMVGCSKSDAVFLLVEIGGKRSIAKVNYDEGNTIKPFDVETWTVDVISTPVHKARLFPGINGQLVVLCSNETPRPSSIFMIDVQGYKQKEIMFLPPIQGNTVFAVALKPGGNFLLGMVMPESEYRVKMVEVDKEGILVREMQTGIYADGGLCMTQDGFALFGHDAECEMYTLDFKLLVSSPPLSEPDHYHLPLCVGYDRTANEVFRLYEEVQCRTRERFLVIMRFNRN